MATCQVPTETVFSTSVATVERNITSSSLSTVTLTPPTTRTIYSTSCGGSDAFGNCTSTVNNTIFTTEGGSYQTQTIFETIQTSDFIPTRIPINTLFSPCPETSSSSSPERTSTTTSSSSREEPTSSSRPTPTSTSTPSRTSRSSTLTPTVYTAVFTLTAGGQLTTSTSLVTSLANVDNAPHNGPNLGPIIGGIIGGLLGLGLLSAGAWMYWRKSHNRWDDIFDKTDPADEPRRDMNLLDNEPKPYEYGLVGSQPPPGPPQSPPWNAGDMTNSAPPQHEPHHAHNRTPSGAPLLHAPPDPTSGLSAANTAPYQPPPNTAPPNFTGQSTPSIDTGYSYGYPPQASPPFIPTGLPVSIRPESENSRYPSHTSSISGRTVSPPGSVYGGMQPIVTIEPQPYMQGYTGPSASALPGPPPGAGPSQYGMTLAVGPPPITRKQRPQSYQSGGSSSYSSSSGQQQYIPGQQFAMAQLGPQSQLQQGHQGLSVTPAPPSYDFATSSSGGSQSDNVITKSSHSGSRLTTTNPDPSDSPARTRLPEKGWR